MKVLVRAVLATTVAMAAQSVFAQTCTPAQGALTGAQSGTTVTTDTCTATNQLATACSGLSPIGVAPDAIWSLTIGPGTHSGNLVVTPTAAWDPYLMVLSGACAASSTCAIDQDNAGPSAPETGAIDGLANGTYFLVITDESGAGAGCGTATVAIPTLPVSLQSFTVS